jgi:Cu/Ag efflux pump CusA
VGRIRRLLLDTPSGGHVRLGDVARVGIVPNPASIGHDSVSRYVDVRADVPGGDVGAVRRAVERQIQQVSFPLEYHAELLKPPANGTSHGRFVTFVIAAEIGILLLLQAALGGWTLAVILFLSLPLAALGGVLVALASGVEHSLGAVAGLLAVVGLAVRHGVILIARTHQLERQEGAVFGRSLVLRAARERLAPTVLAAVTIGVALLPFALAGDVPGNEITQPMAAVTLGGLVTATLLSLYIVPAIYLHFGPRAPRMTFRARGRRAPVPVLTHVNGGSSDASK